MEYAGFEQSVQARLDAHLPEDEARVDESARWVDALVDRVLADAQAMGPELRALFREELRPESPEAARQSARFDAQARAITVWWEETVGTPPFEGAIHALILLLVGAELRIADTRDDAERRRLRRGITFVIQSAIDRYRMDPGRALPLVPGDDGSDRGAR